MACKHLGAGGGRGHKASEQAAVWSSSPSLEASQLVISRRQADEALRYGGGCPLVPQDDEHQAGLLCPGSHAGLGTWLGATVATILSRMHRPCDSPPTSFPPPTLMFSSSPFPLSLLGLLFPYLALGIVWNPGGLICPIKTNGK